MATLKDIANMTGVSTATISRILNDNDQHSFSKETIEQVKEVARSLNYVPSRKKKIKKQVDTINTLSLRIAVVFWFQESLEHGYEYYHGIRMGLEKRFIERNIQFKRYYTVNQLVQSEKRELDGIIATGKFSSFEIKQLESLSCPIIFVDTSPNPLKYGSVVVDFFKAVHDIIDYLVNNGHKSIGYIGMKEYTVSTKEPIPDVRKDSFEMITKYKDIFNKSHVYIIDESTPSAGYNIIKDRVIHQEIPDAFIVFSDTIAMGVLRGLLEEGISVPNDLSIISFDDLPIAEYTFPPLSTVRIQTEMMGSFAFDLMVDQILNKEKLPKKIVIPHELIIRESSRRLSNR
ncbi:LacI family DNA-binding transcriptional regulator [Niallia sp. Krafla_26]|uniref:LacI family DNA-binding transcriptional regulator n=1 Tax=Niallia sp. Krafla_26 TaxID=3064703 RepID=UPI003D170C7A